MTIYGAVLPGAAALARGALPALQLSAQAKQRLAMLDWYRAHGKNLCLAARHFGVHRRMLRVWRDRFAQEGLRGLECRSRRPRQVRKPRVAPGIVAKVVALRTTYPAWSKYKLQPLLPAALKTSVSTVGRILKRRGLIDRRIAQKRSKSAKHPKARFPRGMKIAAPGDMIQMDTKYIMLPGGRRWYQFTAIDVLTKQRVLELYPTQSSRNGARFLEVCRREFSFPIGAVQTDNGAPFQKEFLAACTAMELPHFFTHPRSPKENTYVEISHGADEREFYRQGNIIDDFETMRGRLKAWQETWNTVRPHQALNYLTPRRYYEKWQHSRLPTKDVITLQT